MMPIAKSCAPAKMAMIDAKKVKPGTLPPWIKNRPTTKKRIHNPKSVQTNPITEAICKGRVEKDVNTLSACFNNFVNE